MTNINWNNDIDIILAQMVDILNQIFEGTDYWCQRNPTLTEKCVNVHVNGRKGRIISIFPKKKLQAVHMGIDKELFMYLKARMPMPKDTDIKPGRYHNWRALQEIPFSTAVDICKARSNK